MQNSGFPPDASKLSANRASRASTGFKLNSGAKCLFSEKFPLCFPKKRWEKLDGEERQRLGHAQRVLEALQRVRVRTLNTLESDTELRPDDLGPALGVLDELSLIDWEENIQQEELIVSLIATPEEHLEVHFPDGESRWIFITRPLEEPFVSAGNLN